jgi:hypothetical protein
MKKATSHLHKLRTKVVQLYSLMSNVLSTLCHLIHPKLLLQAHIQKYKEDNNKSNTSSSKNNTCDIFKIACNEVIPV